LAPIVSRVIARNAAINLVAMSLPIGFALVAIPVLIHHVGTERFGVLSLSWVILGYAAVLDLGMARATTKFVAEAIANDRREWLGSIVRTSLFLHLILGGTLAAVFGVLRDPITTGVLGPPPWLLNDTATTLSLLAIALPFVLVGNGARSILEASQRFDLVSAVSIPASALMYGLPALGAAVGLELPTLVLLMVLNRAAASMVYVLLALGQVPEALSATVLRVAARALIGFGSWVAISSFVLPVLVYGDRFLASAILGVAAIGPYSATSDAITRLWVVPGAIASVIFPALSSLAALNGNRYVEWPAGALRIVLTFIAPILWATTLVSGELMSLWLGPAISGGAASLLRILIVGVLAGAIGYFPVTALQAMGRPDLPAKLQLAQLAPYLALTAYLISTLGIVGAALAWSARTVVDLGIGLIAADRAGAARIGAGATSVLITLSLLTTAFLATPLVQSSSLQMRLAGVAAAATLTGVAAMRSWRRMRQSDR
jgi:O-antigen/teichoic acid export membrane protein